MADRWYFTLRWHPKGPATYEQLQRLAADGDLTPTDLVWPENGDPRRAVEAQSVLNRANFRQKSATSGKWLGQVAQALATAPHAPGATPDWLSDVQQESSVAVVPAVPAMSVVNVEPVNQAAGPPASPVTFPPRLILGGATSRGRVRERNEDCFRLQQWNWSDVEATHEVALLVVADGMGGHQAGDEASKLTVRTVANQFSPTVVAATCGQRMDRAAIAAALDQALHEANRVVHDQANAEARYKGMGATAAVVVIWDGCAYFGHIGDCRVYLYSGTKLNQLTEDQTLVARLVSMGKLTPQEAAQHESRNEVTQAIGKRPTIEPSRAEKTLARGNYLVVACDGLTAHVDAPTLEKLLSWPPVPPHHLASHLVSMADEGGGTDNCTVVVAYFS